MDKTIARLLQKRDKLTKRINAHTVQLQDVEARIKARQEALAKADKELQEAQAAVEVLDATE